MNQLPFFPLSVDTLIPHANNTYSFTYEVKKEKDANLKTSSIYIDDVCYEQAFILIPFQGKNEPLDIGAFSTINASSKIALSNSYEVTFFITVHFQVEVFNYFNNLTLSFKQKELINRYSLCNEVEKLKSLITSHKDLINLKTKSSLLEKDHLKFFDEIYLLLNPSHRDELAYYLAKDLEQRYFLICKQITITLTSKVPVGETLAKVPDYVLEKKEKETHRLSNLNSMSSDYSSTLDYLDLLDSIPWGFESQAKLNIKELQANLNKTHYGLNSVKQNIIEYFSLEQLTDSHFGNVFLFLGPPGTGKTTIAKAIALAVGREYVQISLAGISDEAEIRGHRRTYVGSKSGRIVSAFAKCTTMNPLILLDEVDKISSNKGDPSSALLELLDPVQNIEFLDKYLEIPINLSKCIFICTANYEDNIPSPLLDRMEIIHFPEYTKDEKKLILNSYIIPAILNDLNLNNYNIVFTDSLKAKIIVNNLRGMKNIVARLCRNAAHQILTQKQSKILLSMETYRKVYKIKKEKRRLGFGTRVHSSKYKNPSS